MYTCARHVGCDFIPQNPENQNTEYEQKLNLI